MAELLTQVKCPTETVYLQTDEPILCKQLIPSINLPYEAGFQAGFTDGLAKGTVVGINQASEEIKLQSVAMLNQLSNLVASIQDALSLSRIHLATEVSSLVLFIVQQLFINQQSDKAAIEQQIMSVIKKLNNTQTIILSLHPNDLAIFEQNKNTLDFSVYKNLRFQSDNNLSLGGCLIQTSHGLFDASIERQIERLKQVLLEIKQQQ